MNASGFGFNGFSDPEKKIPKYDRYLNAALLSVRPSLPLLCHVLHIHEETKQVYIANDQPVLQLRSCEQPHGMGHTIFHRVSSGRLAHYAVFHLATHCSCSSV